MDDVIRVPASNIITVEYTSMEHVRKYQKRATETRKIIFQFGPALQTGETITTPTGSSNPAGVNLASPTISGTDIVALAEAGIVGMVHRLKMEVVTSGNQRLPIVLDLEIIPD